MISEAASEGPQHPAGGFLLAVDLGLQAGLAKYDHHGKLVWHQRRHFSSKKTLKTAAWRLLKEHEVTHLVIEGGGELLEPWLRAAEKQSIQVRQISAETWRQALLLTRQQHSGKDAKKHALQLAQQIIAADKALSPHSLHHNTAEAILAGYWAVIEMAWRHDQTL